MQCGPAMVVVRSRTRRPCRIGLDMASCRYPHSAPPVKGGERSVTAARADPAGRAAPQSPHVRRCAELRDLDVDPTPPSPSVSAFRAESVTKFRASSCTPSPTEMLSAVMRSVDPNPPPFRLASIVMFLPARTVNPLEYPVWETGGTFPRRRRSPCFGPQTPCRPRRPPLNHRRLRPWSPPPRTVSSLSYLLLERGGWKRTLTEARRLLGEATRTTTADAHAGCNAPETRDERAARGSTGVGIDGGRER